LTDRYVDLVEEAMLTLGESAPDTVEEILKLPKVKLFTGALKAYETSGGRRVFRATASSTIKDLHGDLMTEDCIRDMALQARNGPTGNGLTIFLNHRYNVPEDVAGKVAGSQVLNRENDEAGLPIWDMDYEISLASGSARLDQTWNLIHNDGITLGISIGAYILEYDFVDKEEGFWGGLIINKVLLVETSIVGIPANQRSWIQNGVIAIGKSLGIEEKTIRRVLDGKEARPMTLKTASTDTVTVAPQIINDGDSVIHVPGKTAEGDVVYAKESNDVLLASLREKAVEAPEAPSADEAQEPAEAAPETESPAEPIEETSETPDVETTEADAAPALDAIAPDIALSLNSGSTPTVELVLAALEQAAATLSTVRAEKAILQVKYDEVVAERDQAVKDRNDAAEIIAIVARSPLGRKTQFQAPVQSFRAKFGDIYDEAFLKLLETE
jgi:hypothetical protein